MTIHIFKTARRVCSHARQMGMATLMVYLDLSQPASPLACFPPFRRPIDVPRRTSRKPAGRPIVDSVRWWRWLRPRKCRSPTSAGALASVSIDRADDYCLPPVSLSIRSSWRPGSGRATARNWGDYASAFLSWCCRASAMAIETCVCRLGFLACRFHDVVEQLRDFRRAQHGTPHRLGMT
jgi:hypothetical protein